MDSVHVDLAQEQSITLLHISDLHFGPPYVSRVGEALLREAPLLNPHLIVASGDFTQRAKPDQFAAARRFLDALPDVPKIVVPGNHDVPLYRVVERWRDPFRYYRQYIADELDQVIDFRNMRIVALNSTAPRRAITNGRIRRSQMELCKEAFSDQTDDTLRVIVAHHHFAPAPDYEKNEYMPRAKRALELFQHLRVDMILGGHLHRAYIGNSLDVHAGADRDHGIIIIQCGTSTSRRGRAREAEKNSFNLIRIDDRLIHVMQYMYFDELDGFAVVGEHVYPRVKVKYLSVIQEGVELGGHSDE